MKKAPYIKKVVYIGYDPRELDAFLVTRHSLIRHSMFVDVRGLIMRDMQKYGHYYRKHSKANGMLYDHISHAQMSTEFALTRFLTYMLAKNEGAEWAVFMDSDMLVMSNIEELFALADPKYAVMCVKHDPNKHVTNEKMDGQVQTQYPCKNWSSVMLINCNHKSNEKLTVDLINTAKGKDLHSFCWLKEDEIGEIPGSWNHLVDIDEDPQSADILHFTLGVPTMTHRRGGVHEDWYQELLTAIRGA